MRALLRTLAGRGAVAGPARPWLQAGASYDRARRARSHGLGTDTEAHLPRLVLTADLEALSDLARAGARLAGRLRPATAEKLPRRCGPGSCTRGGEMRSPAPCSCTRRPCVARMGQLRELYAEARRPGERARTGHRPRRGPTHGSRCPACVASKAWSRHWEERSSDFRLPTTGSAAQEGLRESARRLATATSARGAARSGRTRTVRTIRARTRTDLHNRRTTVMGIHPVPNEDLVNLRTGSC